MDELLKDRSVRFLNEMKRRDITTVEGVIILVRKEWAKLNSVLAEALLLIEASGRSVSFTFRQQAD